jgi:hypothetical protein
LNQHSIIIKTLILSRTANFSQHKKLTNSKILKDWNARPVVLKMKQPKQIIVDILKNNLDKIRPKENFICLILILKTPEL